MLIPYRLRNKLKMIRLKQTTVIILQAIHISMDSWFPKLKYFFLQIRMNAMTTKFSWILLNHEHFSKAI